MGNVSQVNLKLFLFTLGFFMLGIFYYWLVREPTMVSEFLGIYHYTKEITLIRIDWFPSFVHQFSFVIFTWLALEKKYLWFSLIFWLSTNSLFELGQALPSNYMIYFPSFLTNYFQNGTYSHGDMLALVGASFLAYILMIKYQKKEY